MREVYTTGQVAKICLVAPRTVAKWIDTGHLKGWRMPGSEERRVPRKSLAQFLKLHGMPALEDRGEGVGVLLVGCSQLLVDRLGEYLPPADGYVLAVAASGFEAGLHAGGQSVVIIDLAMGRNEGLSIAKHLRSRRKDLLLYALMSEDDTDSASVSSHGFDDWYRKPFDVAVLVQHIKEAIHEND